jgi:hypothetical protein
MALFAVCPDCGQSTARKSNLTPLDKDEALSILRHAQFEVFYARRCALRGIPIDGPIPEDTGGSSLGGRINWPRPTVSGRSDGDAAPDVPAPPGRPS